MNRPRSFAFVRRSAAVFALTAMLAPAAHADDKCREGASAASDAVSIAEVRAAIEVVCPCASAVDHKEYTQCIKEPLEAALDGNLSGFSLRKACKGEVKKLLTKSTCGYAGERVMCCEFKTSSGKKSGAAKASDKCVDTASGSVDRHACIASPFSFAPEACSFDATNTCTPTPLVIQETHNLVSPAEPNETPGSAGVVVTNPKLITQFGGASFSLNNVRYTRYHLEGAVNPPEAILILIPGFEGGAGNFRIFAENLIERALINDFQLEVWGYDRRSNQLEDLEGMDVAEQYASPKIGLDWFFGGELGLTLHPVLQSGLNRRAVFYDTQADVPFVANWTPLTFSRDIDVLVELAGLQAVNSNVYLGGHSAGTGFTARYASTDFDLTGGGPAEPGYAKVRGLVLLEGGGGSTAGTPLTADTLDRIEAKFDGGLFGAVRDNAARCVDGTTTCTISTEAADCVGQLPPKCTLPTTSYAIVPGLLNARILSAGEISAVQSIADPDTGENILGVDQGAVNNNAIAVVPDLSGLSTFGTTTATAGLGSFIDDDGFVAGLASFVSTSVGGNGPQIGLIKTWRDITEGVAGANLPDNGAAPATLPAGVWGQEKEVTRMDRLTGNFYVGETNFTDTYYPSSGLGITAVSGVCSAGTCTVGNVGAVCSSNGQCSQSVSMDSTALSVGRGRRDIENLTQAANINVPVIVFGGSNGLTTVPGSFTAFGSSIGLCTAPSCDGTPRIVNASTPSTAFPTFGDIPGGFEAYIAEGFAHLDVLTAEDDANNPIPAALVAFLERNIQ